MNNFGLQLEAQVNPRDWVFGGLTGIINEVLQPDGQWDSSLPAYETQVSKYFDTYSCVSFGTLNCLEALHKRKYQNELNFADRFLAVASNTTVNGNYASVVAETIRTKGLVLEPVYPWDKEAVRTFEEYHKKPLDESLYTQALTFTTDKKFQWEWVYGNTPEMLKEALKYSPLGISVHAWTLPVNGIYPRTTLPLNHWIMLYGYEDGKYWKIFDHYDGGFKKLAWDFAFGSAIKYNITNNLKPMLEIANDTLVQLVESPGGFALALDGKLIIDDLDKILASWAVRNKGNTAGKTLAIKKADWDSLPHINLKGQVV